MLKEQKEAINRAINGGMTVLVEVEKLLKFTVKAEKQIEKFDSEIFDNFSGKYSFLGLIVNQEIHPLCWRFFYI